MLLFIAEAAVAFGRKAAPPPPPPPAEFDFVGLALSVAICWLLPALLRFSLPKLSAEELEVSRWHSQLRMAKALCQKLVRQKSCAPILVRLAWHDSGTYDKANASKPWPEAGGAIASIRCDHELNAGPNAGLRKAIEKYLSAIKEQVPLVSWADLIQMASAVAIETTGGPCIPMRYGRADGVPKSPAPAPFGLPDALPPFGGPLNDKSDAAEHLRYVFYKCASDVPSRIS